MDPYSAQYAGNMARTGGVQAQLQMGQDKIQQAQFLQNMALQQQQVEQEAAYRQMQMNLAQEQAAQEAQQFAAQQQMAQQEMAQKGQYYDYLSQGQQADIAYKQQQMQLEAEQRAMEQQAGAGLYGAMSAGGDSLLTPEQQKYIGSLPENIRGKVASQMADFNYKQQKESNVGGYSGMLYRQAMDMYGDPAMAAAFVSSNAPRAQIPMSDIGKVNADLAAGRITPEQASAVVNKKTEEGSEIQRRENLAGESLSNMQTAFQQLYDDSGKVNRKVIPLFRQLAFGDSRTFTQAMERAIQNSVYLKTGTAAPPSEMNSLLNQYMPNVIDDDTQIKNKMASFQQFLKSNAPDYDFNTLSTKDMAPPSGAKLVGTSGGKKVFQLPDGSYIQEQ